MEKSKQDKRLSALLAWSNEQAGQLNINVEPSTNIPSTNIPPKTTTISSKTIKSKSKTKTPRSKTKVKRKATFKWDTTRQRIKNGEYQPYDQWLLDQAVPLVKDSKKSGQLSLSNIYYKKKPRLLKLDKGKPSRENVHAVFFQIFKESLHKHNNSISDDFVFELITSIDYNESNPSLYIEELKGYLLVIDHLHSEHLTHLNGYIQNTESIEVEEFKVMISVELPRFSNPHVYYSKLDKKITFRLYPSANIPTRPLPRFENPILINKDENTELFDHLMSVLDDFEEMSLSSDMSPEQMVSKPIPIRPPQHPSNPGVTGDDELIGLDFFEHEEDDEDKKQGSALTIKSLFGYVLAAVFGRYLTPTYWFDSLKPVMMDSSTSVSDEAAKQTNVIKENIRLATKHAYEDLQKGLARPEMIACMTKSAVSTLDSLDTDMTSGDIFDTLLKGGESTIKKLQEMSRDQFVENFVFEDNFVNLVLDSVMTHGGVLDTLKNDLITKYTLDREKKLSSDKSIVPPKSLEANLIVDGACRLAPTVSNYFTVSIGKLVQSVGVDIDPDRIAWCQSNGDNDICTIPVNNLVEKMKSNFDNLPSLIDNSFTQIQDVARQERHDIVYHSVHVGIMVVVITLTIVLYRILVGVFAGAKDATTIRNRVRSTSSSIGSISSRGRLSTEESFDSRRSPIGFLDRRRTLSRSPASFIDNPGSFVDRRSPVSFGLTRSVSGGAASATMLDPDTTRQLDDLNISPNAYATGGRPEGMPYSPKSSVKTEGCFKCSKPHTNCYKTIKHSNGDYKTIYFCSLYGGCMEDEYKAFKKV